MKNLILIISLFLLNIGLAQTITIENTEFKEIGRIGKFNPEDVIDDPDNEGNLRDCKGGYIIDTVKKTSTFYKNGKIISTVPVTKIEYNGSIIKIHISDVDELLGEFPFDGILTIDVEKNTSNYYWYNKWADKSYMQYHTKTKISYNGKKIIS
jgi:hypothetical protein